MLSCEIDDHITIATDGGESREITDVALGGDFCEVGVDHQVVATHLVSSALEFGDESRPDETASTGNEYLHSSHHNPRSSINASTIRSRFLRRRCRQCHANRTRLTIPLP